MTPKDPNQVPLPVSRTLLHNLSYKRNVTTAVLNQRVHPGHVLSETGIKQTPCKDVRRV